MCRKIIYIILILSGLLNHLNAQYLKKISAYDNNYNNNSGIFAISDTAIYEYSWYFSRWHQLSSNGLVRNNGVPVINDISAFDNSSLNPSGIYVISDTAVFVFNYYTDFWHPLSNNGLIRDNGIVQLSSVSAHKEEGTGNVRVHVVSDTSVFRYNWHTQTWFQFPNEGLITFNKEFSKQTVEVSAHPNPFYDKTTISFSLPKDYSGKIRIALFSKNGEFIEEIKNYYNSGGEQSVEISGSKLKQGLYFYEISGSGFSQAKKLILIR